MAANRWLAWVVIGLCVVGLPWTGQAASGDTLFVFLTSDNEPPVANAAVDGDRNAHDNLLFDDTTNEDAIFPGLLPQHYASGGITCYLWYAMTSATSGDIDWDIAWERIPDEGLDIDGDSFAAVQSADNVAVPSTSGFMDQVSIVFTDGAQIDSLAIGEPFRLKVTRDAASDTSTGDAELYRVECRES